MSEFKAQILGILIVISIFGILSVAAKTLINNTWNQVSSQLDSTINEPSE